ncbi:hypothetical protein RclHR1_19290002 [Rhizophagus clarus]|uniref:HMG box domain-containing protein n=1 Tax=Rhizophagus clarus TaxID=94130 RepID=A0A2Z6QNY4_9GLOM|nr:hypothetical protein RclHR1_19290002 [Rhizophagus clarus]GES85013.1 hypothetical protein GLOIN_2v1769227 [Rhizophagus clarus]
MSQEENINSSPAVFDIQREYEIISENTNILLNHPIELSFNNLPFSSFNYFFSRKTSKGYIRVPNAFLIFRRVIIQELGKHYKNISQSDISRFISQKWKELPSDVKQRYVKISNEFREYISYRKDPPTYQLIKF